MRKKRVKALRNQLKTELDHLPTKSEFRRYKKDYVNSKNMSSTTPKSWKIKYSFEKPWTKS